jgi:hypothetical protein
MPEPPVVQAIRAHKAALLARETKQMKAMAKVWATVEAQLAAEMDALALEIDALRKAGQVVNPGKVYRMERYQRLLFQVRSEASGYADYTAKTVAAQQLENTWIAQQEAAEALRLSAKGTALETFQAGPPGLSATLPVSVEAAGGASPSFVQLNASALENMVGMMADGTPLRTHLKAVYGDAAKGMSKYLTRAVAQGLNPRQTAREMRRGLRLGLDRALVIARTEQLRAYREAQRMTYEESGVVLGYKRLAAKQARTCLGCLVEDGRFYRTEEAFEDHPQGRCSLVPIVEGADLPQWETGQEWLAKQPEATQRKIMGPGRLALYQSGEVPLSAMATHTHDPIFGGAWVPTPLKDLTGSGTTAAAAPPA